MRSSWIGAIPKSNDWCPYVKRRGHREIQGKDHVKMEAEGFPGGTVVKNPPANAGDAGSSPGPGRSHMLRSN